MILSTNSNDNTTQEKKRFRYRLCLCACLCVFAVWCVVRLEDIQDLLNKVLVIALAYVCVCCEQRRKNIVIGLKRLRQSVRLNKQHTDLKDWLTAVSVCLIRACLPVNSSRESVCNKLFLTRACLVVHLSQSTAGFKMRSRPLWTSALLFKTALNEFKNAITWPKKAITGQQMLAQVTDDYIRTGVSNL